MNVINKSKILFVVFFAIHAMNMQSFAADKRSQNQTSFLSKAKFYITAMALAATSTLAASSIDIDLDEDSKLNLLNQVKRENVKTRYWPEEVSVKLMRFYVTEGSNNEPKYCGRFVGFYQGFIDAEWNEGEIIRLPAKLGKPTEGCFFSQTELETFGVILPEKFRDLKEFNRTGNIYK